MASGDSRFVATMTALNCLSVCVWMAFVRHTMGANNEYCELFLCEQNNDGTEIQFQFILLQITWLNLGDSFAYSCRGRLKGPVDRSLLYSSASGPEFWRISRILLELQLPAAVQWWCDIAGCCSIAKQWKMSICVCSLLLLQKNISWLWGPFLFPKIPKIHTGFWGTKMSQNEHFFNWITRQKCRRCTLHVLTFY